MSSTLTIPSLLRSQVAKLTVIGRIFVELALALSFTLKVTEIGPPTAAGVPEITPLELSDSPAGNAPVTIDQVYGVVPPVAVNVCE